MGTDFTAPIPYRNNVIKMERNKSKNKVAPIPYRNNVIEVVKSITNKIDTAPIPYRNNVIFRILTV